MIAPVPVQTPMFTGQSIALAWLNWFRSLVVDMNAAPQTIATVTLSGQTASIGATAIATPTLTEGRYRISWYFRITTVGSVSSSLALTFGSTDATVACTQSTTAYTGNVTTAPQSGSIIVQADAGSSLTYATTYASNLAAEMVYALRLTVEALA